MREPLELTLTCCFIAMRFDQQHLTRALELLVSATGPTRAKHGCRAARVERDVSAPDSIRYSEEWESPEAFTRHVGSDDFWRILLAIDLCVEEPSVVVGTLNGRRGLESISSLRNARPAIDVADPGSPGVAELN